MDEVDDNDEIIADGALKDDAPNVDKTINKYKMWVSKQSSLQPDVDVDKLAPEAGPEDRQD